VGDELGEAMGPVCVITIEKRGGPLGLAICTVPLPPPPAANLYSNQEGASCSVRDCFLSIALGLRHLQYCSTPHGPSRC
jgi:hypothetical protein